MSNLKLDHEYWMHYAIQLAQFAWKKGEVPVGAVLIHNDNVIGEGWNSPISRCDPTAHAEIIALRQGGLLVQNYRVLNTTLYVTLAPCMMCSGAILHSRVSTLVYGAENRSFEMIDILPRIIECQRTGHKIKIIRGILEETCSSLLNKFFRIRRLAKKTSKKRSKPGALDPNRK